MKMLTTCIEYSDFLEESLKYSSKIFTDILVCTIARDKKTQQLCSKYPNARAIVSEDRELLHNGGSFNKARIMNKGLKTLQNEKYNGYLCLADADTIIADFRNDFNHHINEVKKSGGDPQWMIFGLDRYLARTRETYKEWGRDKTVKNIRSLTGSSPTGNNGMGHEKAFTGYFQLFYFNHDPDYICPQTDGPIWLMNETFTSTYSVDMWFVYQYIHMCILLNNSGIVKDFKRNDPLFLGSQCYTSSHTFEPNKHIVGMMLRTPNCYSLHLGDPNINRNGRVSEVW